MCGFKKYCKNKQTNIQNIKHPEDDIKIHFSMK